jgi:hypothetical protein
MKRLSQFFRNFFLANGVLWFLCGLSTLIFKFHLGPQELLATLLLPLAYAIVRLFDGDKT